MDTQERARGKVVLCDRKSITIDGVEHILNFDEGYIAISTALGELNVEGEGMKIENLSKEKGEIYISGRVNALYYKEKSNKRRKAF